MLKKFKKTLVVLSFSMVVGVATIAQAIPRVIETEQGTCYYSGQSQYNYIYTCENGALWYVSKAQNGGGGNDDGGGCDPSNRIC